MMKFIRLWILQATPRLYKLRELILSDEWINCGNSVFADLKKLAGGYSLPFSEDLFLNSSTDLVSMSDCYLRWRLSLHYGAELANKYSKALKAFVIIATEDSRLSLADTFGGRNEFPEIRFVMITDKVPESIATSDHI